MGSRDFCLGYRHDTALFFYFSTLDLHVHAKTRTSKTKTIKTVTMIQVVLILTCSRAARGTLAPQHAQHLSLPNEVTTRNECTAVYGQSCGDMSKPKCKRTNGGEVVITSPPIVHMREICTDITIPTFSCPSSEYKLMCNDGTLAWHVPAVVLSSDCECTLPTISHGNTMVIVANADGSHPSMNGPSGNSESEAASSDIHMESFVSSHVLDEQLIHANVQLSLEYTYENSYWFLCGVVVPWATCVLFEIVHILLKGTSLMSSNLLVKIVPRDAYDGNDARNTKSINPRAAHVV